MADFLTRLVERTFGLMQVAEPMITPSFAAEPAPNMDYMESSVFDIKPGPDHGVSQPEAHFLPRGIAVAYPGYDAGIKERGTIAGSNPFEVKPAGTQARSGHEQSGFDLLPGTMSDKQGSDMIDVIQQLPEDAAWKNDKTVYHPQPMIREIRGDEEPGFARDIHAENAENGENTVYNPQPKPLIHEMTENDEPDFARDIHVEHGENGDKTVYGQQLEPMIREIRGDEEPGFTRDIHAENAENGENTVYNPQPKPLIHEMTENDEPGFTRDIHVEHGENGENTVYNPQPKPLIHEMTENDEPGFARDIHVEHGENGENTVYRPQPGPMISETPVKDENSPEIRRAEIMAAEKKILYQPGRSLNVTGTLEDEVPGDLKKAYTENMKTLNDAYGLFQVQPEHISHEPQTRSADPGNLRKPGSKYQRMENGNQTEFQVAANGEIPEMINLTDSDEKKSAKQGHVYHNVTKPGNVLQIQYPNFSKPGTLVSGQKNTDVDKTPAKLGHDLHHENSLSDRKMFQTYRTGESYISTQKKREIQGSPTSTTIAGTPVSRRKLYQNASAPVNRNPPEKHIAESHSTHPEIKVTIGHVEVRAATKPAQVSVPSRQNPVLSLNDYLKKRNGNTL